MARERPIKTLEILHVICNENHYSLFTGAINKISNKFILAMRRRESGKMMKKLALVTRLMREEFGLGLKIQSVVRDQ